jgi:hypothetical protein
VSGCGSCAGEATHTCSCPTSASPLLAQTLVRTWRPTWQVFLVSTRFYLHSTN